MQVLSEVLITFIITSGIGLILAIIKELQFQLTQTQKDRPWEKGL